jgi:hypothetical protein
MIQTNTNMVQTLNTIMVQTNTNMVQTLNAIMVQAIDTIMVQATNTIMVQINTSRIHYLAMLRIRIMLLQILLGCRIVHIFPEQSMTNLLWTNLLWTNLLCDSSVGSGSIQLSLDGVFLLRKRRAFALVKNPLFGSATTGSATTGAFVSTAG